MLNSIKLHKEQIRIRWFQFLYEFISIVAPSTGFVMMLNTLLHAGKCLGKGRQTTKNKKDEKQKNKIKQKITIIATATKLRTKSKQQQNQQ